MTATDVLERILARDDAPLSASTLLRDAGDPALILGEATERYVDALYVAAEHLAGPAIVSGLDAAAHEIAPDLPGEPAWPALRAHLMLLAAHGGDPIEHLRQAADGSELDTARDDAAVIAWRLDSSGLRNSGAGPLPWIPGIPSGLAASEHWGQYLTRRAQLVSDLASEVRATTARPKEWHRNESESAPRLLRALEAAAALVSSLPTPRQVPQVGGRVVAPRETLANISITSRDRPAAPNASITEVRGSTWDLTSGHRWPPGRQRPTDSSVPARRRSLDAIVVAILNRLRTLLPAPNG